MILMIDNYDSFTYNIVQYFSQLGQEIVIYKNDEITLPQIEKLAPKYLIIGPGPCSPKEAGISVPLIKYFAGKIPILGICLGHQAITEAFGGNVVGAKTLMHGKVSQVYHQNIGVFYNIPNPVICTRYHSLVIEKSTLSDQFEITAWTEDEEIMAVRHKVLALEGVQFHPEALLTEYGHQMLQNFIDEHKDFNLK